MIHSADIEPVLDHLRALVGETEGPAHFRAGLRHAVDEVAGLASSVPAFLPVDLPLAVGGALGASSHAAAALCASLWRGADLLDDLADGDAPSPWRDEDPALVTLVASNLLSTFPHLLVDRLGLADPAAVHVAIARSVRAMSAGQYQDVARLVATHADYEAMVGRKTGAQAGLYADLAARAAGADPAGWHAFGALVGRIAQVFSDVADTADLARDLRAGRTTRPFLVALDRADATAAATLRADLAAAGHDPEAAGRLQAALCDVEVLRRSLLLVELARYRAVEALPIPLSQVPAGHPLRALLCSWSVTPISLPGGSHHEGNEEHPADRQGPGGQHQGLD